MIQRYVSTNLDIPLQSGLTAPFWTNCHQKVAKIWGFDPHVFQEHLR